MCRFRFIQIHLGCLLPGRRDSHRRLIQVGKAGWSGVVSKRFYAVLESVGGVSERASTNRKWLPISKRVYTVLELLEDVSERA